jgi:hypothetical protein
MNLSAEKFARDTGGARRSPQFYNDGNWPFLMSQKFLSCIIAQIGKYRYLL